MEKPVDFWQKNCNLAMIHDFNFAKNYLPIYHHCPLILPSFLGPAISPGGHWHWWGLGPLNIPMILYWSPSALLGVATLAIKNATLIHPEAEAPEDLKATNWSRDSWMYPYQRTLMRDPYMFFPSVCSGVQEAWCGSWRISAFSWSASLHFLIKS